MKQTRARILSILAAAALTVCSLPQSMPLLHSHAITGITADVANPASEFETVQIGDTVRITGWNGSGNAVVLPAKIDGLPVTAIGDNAFSGNKTLTKVSIPNCITAIGRNAFANCGKLEIIHIPASITEIGSGAFAQTAWLAAKRAENPLVTVNTVLVDGSMCEGWVKVPGGITTIADMAFYGNQSVKSVNLPDTVSVIGDSAFEACTMLERIGLPDQLTAIGDHAFERCTILQRLDIGENVLTIGEDAF
nr:leucine-rich repeat domain-containing protein [Oscillospiraceae bacterium]